MRLYIAGHTGLVGSALMRHFAARSDVELLTATRAMVDLTDAAAVRRYVVQTRPDAVVLAAGLIGGIAANVARPAEFIYQNVMIEANVIHEAWAAGVKRLLNFGSSCMYPVRAEQPMRVDALMTGPVEPTSQPYAMAKLAGATLCAAYRRQYGARFITAIPATVYGPGDSFELEHSHVLSALLRRLHEAHLQHRAEITLWGTGTPRREFIYVDDLVHACDVLLEQYDDASPINVGPGMSVMIRDAAALAAEIVGFRGQIHWDASRPDGAPEKVLESSAIRRLGWTPRISLREGLQRTYQWFLAQQSEVRQEASCASS